MTHLFVCKQNSQWAKGLEAQFIFGLFLVKYRTHVWATYSIIGTWEGRRLRMGMCGSTCKLKTRPEKDLVATGGRIHHRTQREVSEPTIIKKTEFENLNIFSGEWCRCYLILYIYLCRFCRRWRCQEVHLLLFGHYMSSLWCHHIRVLSLEVI